MEITLWLGVSTTGGTALEGGSVGKVENQRSQGCRRSGLELSGEEVGTGTGPVCRTLPSSGSRPLCNACDFLTHRWCPFPSRKKPILVQGLPHSCFLQGCLRIPSTSSLLPAPYLTLAGIIIGYFLPWKRLHSVGAPISSSSFNR